MKPFVIGEKRLAFDLTNADDLARLERAVAAFCRTCGEMDAAQDGEETGGSVAQELQRIYALYRDFFGTVFPGRAEEIVGSAPSVGNAKRAFDRFAAYLQTCLEEERRQDDAMRLLYLGRSGAGDEA